VAVTPPSAGLGCGGAYTARDARNQRRFLLWLFAAALAYVGATAALRWRQSVPGVLPWLLTGLALILAAQAVRRYLIFLRAADELLRKIETGALALGFGAGAFFSILYPLLEKLGAPELGRSATPVVMMLSWALGSWLGTRRYSGGGAP
jgi:hypothetical protein